MENISIENSKCPWHDKCRNGADGCWILEPEKCVRFLPLEGTNLININGTIETPHEIDIDKFSQYFSNWIDGMGWSFCGSMSPYTDEIGD